MPAPRLVQGQSLPAKSILMLHGPSANTTHPSLGTSHSRSDVP